MNPSPISPGRTRPLPGEVERQVPSGIVSACHFQARWHTAAGIVFLTLMVTAPLWLFQFAERVRLLTAAMGRAPTVLPQRMELFAGLCGLLALANAVGLFFGAAALRHFANSRLVLDLHTAMRRLRLVWLMLSLSAAFIAGAVIWADLSGLLKAIP